MTAATPTALPSAEDALREALIAALNRTMAPDYWDGTWEQAMAHAQNAVEALQSPRASDEVLGEASGPVADGETLDQYADRIVAKTRRNMMDRLDDDVIGEIRSSHLVFGKACAMEAVWTAMREMGNALSASPVPVDASGVGRFWLIVHEPGCVPERKGPWLNTGFKEVLRDFINARPTAYLTVLTVGEDGVPHVQHGPEALQMADGRSMSVGRKHNARTLAAHTAPVADAQAGEGGL